ncbi:hypothetical protein M885DRAFT_560408 [Pelagophyceae sp. CCMP2097]|nr:hypothetical protein M885DRAFT_560408 [Pelagophyceae sp. CCMP2097]
MSLTLARTLSRLTAPLSRPTSRPAARQKSAGHAGLDQHGHNQHMCFDGQPFDKRLIGGMIGFCLRQPAPVIFERLVVGTGVPVFAVWFQNKKHGFIK